MSFYLWNIYIIYIFFSHSYFVICKSLQFRQVWNFTIWLRFTSEQKFRLFSFKTFYIGNSTVISMNEFVIDRVEETVRQGEHWLAAFFLFPLIFSKDSPPTGHTPGLYKPLPIFWAQQFSEKRRYPQSPRIVCGVLQQLHILQCSVNSLPHNPYF